MNGCAFCAVMKRSDLEHILRASKGVTGETEFIVIGSQAILGPFPDAPRVLRQSMEADLYPKYRPELSADIEGSLGELSLFHQTHGYLADGVSPNTATLPKGWEERLIRLSNENTGGVLNRTTSPSANWPRVGRKTWRSSQPYCGSKWCGPRGSTRSSRTWRTRPCASGSPRH